MGRRIWVAVPRSTRLDYDTGRTWHIPGHVYDCRVLSFVQFIPAQGDVRPKHLVQLWTDPGGVRTLSVGSIRLKDPKRVAAAKARHERERAAVEE